MSAHDLLPPNSTQLQRDLVRSLNAIRRLAPFIQALRLAKVQARGIPPTVLPWLVLELGLDEISDYHPDLETTLEKGVPWQWIRGTPQAAVAGWEGNRVGCPVVPLLENTISWSSDSRSGTKSHTLGARSSREQLGIDSKAVPAGLRRR